MFDNKNLTYVLGMYIGVISNATVGKHIEFGLDTHTKWNGHNKFIVFFLYIFRIYLSYMHNLINLFSTQQISTIIDQIYNFLAKYVERKLKSKKWTQVYWTIAAVPVSYFIHHPKGFLVRILTEFHWTSCKNDEARNSSMQNTWMHPQKFFWF